MGQCLSCLKAARAPKNRVEMAKGNGPRRQVSQHLDLGQTQNQVVPMQKAKTVGSTRNRSNGNAALQFAHHPVAKRESDIPIETSARRKTKKIIDPLEYALSGNKVGDHSLCKDCKERINLNTSNEQPRSSGRAGLQALLTKDKILTSSLSQPLPSVMASGGGTGFLPRLNSKGNNLIRLSKTPPEFQDVGVQVSDSHSIKIELGDSGAKPGLSTTINSNSKDPIFKHTISQKSSNEVIPIIESPREKSAKQVLDYVNKRSAKNDKLNDKSIVQDDGISRVSPGSLVGSRRHSGFDNFVQDIMKSQLQVAGTPTEGNRIQPIQVITVPNQYAKKSSFWYEMRRRNKTDTEVGSNSYSASRLFDATPTNNASPSPVAKQPTVQNQPPPKQQNQEPKLTKTNSIMIPLRPPSLEIPKPDNLKQEQQAKPELKGRSTPGKSVIESPAGSKDAKKDLPLSQRSCSPSILEALRDKMNAPVINVQHLVQNMREVGNSSIATISEQYSEENKKSQSSSQISVESKPKQLQRQPSFLDQLKKRNLSSVQIGQNTGRDIFNTDAIIEYNMKSSKVIAEEEGPAVGDQFFDEGNNSENG